jgi:hypothetical protein
VLDASFKLSDAQELVARQLGFDGWQALKAGALVMSTQVKQATTCPILAATEAQLYVADVKASCDFFTTKLGFAIDFVYGNPPFYGMVKRDHARLCMRIVCEPVFVDDIREREHLLSASITVDTAAEIKQLFLDFQSEGVSFHQGLKKEPWALGALSSSILMVISSCSRVLPTDTPAIGSYLGRWRLLRLRLVPLGVTLDILSAGRPLPVYPDEQTLRLFVGMSQKCQQRKSRGYSISSSV